MTVPDDLPAAPVPIRALILSLGALGVPVAGALLVPDTLGEYGALLWLLALIPGFLLAYYRGWRGAATALAFGMATLAVTQVIALLFQLTIPDTLIGVVIGYVAIALGIGWMAEDLHRQRLTAQVLAYTDNLTRLPNRRRIRIALENEFSAAERGRPLAVVLFDLDKFKDYNDHYGHPAGDEALRAFGDVLLRTTRQMNLSGRYGGEEFLSVLAESSHDGALVFAERVRAGLRAANLGNGPLTVSAGVATHHPGMKTPDELLTGADDALYRAKRDGRDCVRLFRRTPIEPGPREELSHEVQERADVGRSKIIQGVRYLVEASEAKDPYKAGRSTYVAAYSMELAQAVDPDGELIDRHSLHLGAELHDIGMIGVPDSVLNKPDALTESEWEQVREHPQIGHDLLAAVLDDPTVLAIVKWHQERWDGAGYPDGLSETAIPLGARIVAVADGLEAITSKRAFREALPWAEAVSAITDAMGTRFDPDLLEPFERVAPSLHAMNAESRSPSE